MFRTALASAAFVALAQAVGDAIVVNSCSYTVHLSNTPAMGGGYSTIDKALAPGESYSQAYTELTNGNGWSLKLSKIAGAFSSNILQYEYTFHNDGTIWYDLSEVNGNPWDGNWEITATDGCSPRQAAYRYATDDAYGMQSCGDDATITVTVCSGDKSGSGSAPAWTSTAPVTSSPVETSTSKKNHHHGGHNTWAAAGNKVAAPVGDAILDSTTSESTPASSPAPVAAPEAETPDAWNGPAVTVTNVQMETMTKYVTATEAPAKRHAHHARHPHHRR